jgi:hypothetical protein
MLLFTTLKIQIPVENLTEEWNRKKLKIRRGQNGSKEINNFF